MRSALFSPFSWLYGIVVKTRRKLYQKNVLSSIDLKVKTISVGNITVGGTGKTPLVAYIAQILFEQGEKVCILTRGYGRDNPKERVLVTDGEKVLADAGDAGDEPFELANKLLGKAVIVADAKRSDAGIWAEQEFGVTAFILDDGFQHLQLKRNLDIVLLDATNPFGNGKLLPAGILRESIESLARANAVVITRANLVEDVEVIKAKVLVINPKMQIFVSKNEFTNCIKLKDFPVLERQTSKTTIQNLNSMAFCALGNPDNFFNQLHHENFNLISTKTFPDHYLYTQTDARNIEKIAIEKGVEILLTTAKDAVKLKHLKFNLPCFVMENGLIFENESAFISLIQNLQSPI